MRVMQKIAALAAALALTGALVAPANAQRHSHAGGHAWHGGGHYGHAWHGHRGYAIGGYGGGYYAPYYPPYYGDGYAYGYPAYGYGYPYAYGYREYDPGAAIALSMIGTIGNLIARQAFAHGHYRHHYRHYRHR